MNYFILKCIVSGIIVALVSVIAKRSPALGALVASLPLISILGMIWLWHDTQDKTRMAEHAQATFWYVIPSLPMFLLIPALLKSGWGFWAALSMGIVLTVVLYGLTVMIAGKLGIRL